MIRLDFEEINVITGPRTRHEYWEDAVYERRNLEIGDFKYAPSPFAVLYTYPKSTEIRKDCPYRHGNGNCMGVGGFCLAVDDKYCAKTKELDRR